jgi:hypothetical protein
MTKTAFFSAIKQHNDPLNRATYLQERLNRQTTLVWATKIPHYEPQVDEFDINIPVGKRYAGSVVVSLPPTVGGATASIVSQPSNRATGSGKIRVRWFCPRGGMARYRIRAYYENIPAPANTSEQIVYEDIHIENLQSVERVRSLMISERHLRVIISGDDATKFFDTGISLNPTGVEEVIVICVLAGLSAFALACLTIIAIHAINNTYHVDAEFRTGDPLPFPVLILTLNPK